MNNKYDDINYTWQEWRAECKIWNNDDEVGSVMFRL